MAQTTLGFPNPDIGSNNWGVPTNSGWTLLDQYLRGLRPLTSLAVSGNVTVGGSITAGSFVGADGTFLTSALYDVANGIPQLNGAALIPATLVAPSAIVGVPYTSTPIFNAQLGSIFKIVLTGNVSSSTFPNGILGEPIITFRIVQDSIGGRTFVWPSNVRNAGVIDSTPNSISVQIFSMDTDGSLDAIGPIMYS